MARECEKCGRPNNERAPHCIYCGAPFRPVAAQPAADREPAKKPEIFLIVVSPGQELDGERLQALGREFNLDPYTAVQKLKSPAPWVARTYPEPAAAQELVRRLQGLGLDAYILKQSGIETVSAHVQAKGLRQIGPEAIVFFDGEDRELPVAYADLFLIVRGRIQERPELENDLEEGAQPVRMGRLVMGAEKAGEKKGVIRETLEGIKIKPRPGLMRWVFRGQAVEIMDLYLQSATRAVRVVESEFDYRGLGESMSPSGLLNFYLILAALTRGAPDCPIDVAFNAVGYTMRETPKEDSVRDQLNANLGLSENAKKLFDNRAHFDNFSARVFLHHLRRKKAGPGRQGTAPEAIK